MNLPCTLPQAVLLVVGMSTARAGAATACTPESATPQPESACARQARTARTASGVSAVP